MEKFVLAITGAVTIVGAVLFLFGVTPNEEKAERSPQVSSTPADVSSAQPEIPLAPPDSAVTGTIVCQDCPDATGKTVLQQDGVSVNVSAEAVSPANPATSKPATAKVKVKIKTDKPKTLAPSQTYITLRPESGPDYSLPPSEYRFLTATGETGGDVTRRRDPSPSLATLVTDNWPEVDDTVESELDFLVNVDVLSGRFSVRLPDIVVDGKGYAVPPITFEKK